MDELTSLRAQCVKDLSVVADFVETYLELANLHNTNFFINDYWKQVGPMKHPVSRLSLA